MLDYWIKPVDPILFQGKFNSNAEVIGNSISFFQQGQENLHDIQIALIGVSETEADAVRAHLYSMSFPFKGLRVVDLGNMRRSDPDFLVAPIRELLESRIFPILIGHSDTQALAQYKAFLSFKPWINFVTVDERLRLLESDPENKDFFLNEILLSRSSRLFHFALIGGQAHQILPSGFTFLEERHFDMFRLGAARADFSSMEPIIRDADLLAFHIAAIRNSDAPAQFNPSPSGFSVEEACQICRYAGMSDKLKSLGVFGFQQALAGAEITAQVLAQMVWYAMEGFYHRKGDFPVSTDGLIEYVVDIHDFEHPLVFWKSTRSGRWWMQISLDTGLEKQRHRLIPCTYQDYQSACRNELPDRLIHALSRFSD